MKATYKIVARFHGEGLAAVQALATALDAAAGVEAARVSFPQPHRPHVDFVAYLPAVLAVRVFEAVNAANAESAVKGRLTYLRDRDAVEDLFCPESGPLLDFNIDWGGRPVATLQESESPAVAAAVASPARREEPTEEPATAAASVAAPVGAEEPTEGHPDGLAVFRALDVDEGSHAVREAAGLGDQAKGVLVRIAACLAGLLVRA